MERWKNPSTPLGSIKTSTSPIATIQTAYNTSKSASEKVQATKATPHPTTTAILLWNPQRKRITSCRGWTPSNLSATKRIPRRVRGLRSHRFWRNITMRIGVSIKLRRGIRRLRAWSSRKSFRSMIWGRVMRAILDLPLPANSRRASSRGKCRCNANQWKESPSAKTKRRINRSHQNRRRSLSRQSTSSLKRSSSQNSPNSHDKQDSATRPPCNPAKQPERANSKNTN